MLCEVCGSKEANIQAMIPLWNYGIREVKNRQVCKSCANAHYKGIL